MASRRRRAPWSRLSKRSIAAVIGSLAVALTVGGISVASADSQQADGNYACSFTGSFNCTPAVLPTVTTTATVTATATTTVTETPTSSPSPTQTQAPFILGTSFGGSDAAAVNATETQFPEQDLGRYYFSANPDTFANTPGLAAIPTTEPIIISFKYPVASTVSGANNAAFTTVLRDWNATGRTIYWTWQHEADDPAKGIAQSDFVAGWNQLLSVEAANPNPNVHSLSILMGAALNNGHGPTDGWYVSGVDYIGFDCYFTNSEQAAEAYAVAKGKGLFIPEFGDTVSPGQTDAQAKAFAQAFMADLTPVVLGAAWYNAGNNDLSKFPNTLAYLRSAA